MSYAADVPDLPERMAESVDQSSQGPKIGNIPGLRTDEAHPRDQSENREDARPPELLARADEVVN
jgi:hypothetical protein